MNKPKYKMSVSDRAKQFAPFSALRGLDAALRAKERITVPKKDLSDEMLLELDAKFRQIRKGQLISVVHYEKGEYIKTSGMVSKIEETSRIIQIVNTKIDFDNIQDIILQ